MKRIKELEKLILKHKALYYQVIPEIEDHEYDLLEEELRCLDQNNKVLFLVGSQNGPLQKIKHDKKMLSLAKVYDIEGLEKWRQGREVISTYKIDGVSCSLVYQKGTLIVAKTRGNGSFGEEITDKMNWLLDIPGRVRPDESFEIRGELFCTRKNFHLLSEEMKKRGLECPRNQRNIVAGLLLRKDHIELARYLNFYAFDILSFKKIKKEKSKYTYLKKLGFNITEIELHKKISTVKQAALKAKEFMSNGNYSIDGLVFTLNDISLQEQMGETNHHPRYKMALKYKSDTKTTIINKISWQVSRNGILTPVAHVHPVKLSGAEISRVTLHNYGIVHQHQLKKGDRIEITRSGEVIPKFMAVKEHSVKGRVEIPTQCPSCQQDVIVEGIRIICRNTLCPARIQESILNFIVKIGIDDLSSKRLEQMIKKGHVKSIPDLYELSIEKLLSLNKTKEKLAEKLYKQIQSSKNISLTTFLSSLGIQGGAYNRCEKIVRAGFNTADKILDLDVKKLNSLEGFAIKSATDFINSLKKKKELINRLLKLGFKFETHRKENGFFFNKRVRITGTLSEKRSVVEENLRKQGATIVKNVSKNTDILIVKNTQITSSKLKKAEELGVTVISEKELTKHGLEIFSK